MQRCIQTRQSTLEVESDKVPASITFDDAVRLTIGLARTVGVERISVTDADCRVLAASVIARRTVPPVAVSAMDGYAVRSADLSILPVRLKIVGTAYPGATSLGSISPGECARIFTGAPLPRGADHVIVQEIVTVEGVAARIVSMPDSCHVRVAGSDFHAGQMIVAKGVRLGPQHLIALGGADCEEVDIFRRPRVTILCSGDELVSAGTANGSHNHVPESVSLGIAALVARAGGTVIRRALIPDNLVAMRQAAIDALKSSDLIATVGGASVGDRDYAKAAFACTEMTTLFTRVRMKPGKPTWLGRAGLKPIVGLPGNPTSAVVAARLLLVPLVAAMTGADPGEMLGWRAVRYDGAVQRKSDRDVFVCATHAGDRAHPVSSQDSANQYALAQANMVLRFRPKHLAGGRPRHTVEAIDL